MAVIKVGDILNEKGKELGLHLISSNTDLNRKVKFLGPHRPGLALSGYFDHFLPDRIQVFGETEISYLSKLSKNERARCLKGYFKFDIPCVIVCRNLRLPQELLAQASERKVPVMRSRLSSSSLMNKLSIYLEDRFAPELSLHGTLLDVYGVGVLIMGGSGTGKSECALELLARGHLLVADDVVDIKLKAGKILMGSGADLIRHYMEIRGLGIINVKEIFGAGAVRNRKRIGMVVTLERWNPKKEYERLGLEEKTYKTLGIEVPHLIIPVRPGRNIPVLVEVACLNQRLKRMGFYPAKELNRKLIESMKPARYGISNGLKKGVIEEGGLNEVF